jgi:PAS domain S-box-containing protein
VSALLDRRFDEFAAETHENLTPRALVAVGAGAAALMALPWKLCALWTIAALSIELWGWFASRDQFLGRAVKRSSQLIYLANLAGMIASWFVLGWLFWRTGREDGAICAAITWLSIMGFAQTFASRTPLGFAICGVLPALGVVTVMALEPPSGAREPLVLAIMGLSIAFALAGARQTSRTGRRFEAARQALHDSEATYRVLADNVGDVIGRRALDGAVIYTSPSIEAALGYTPEEFAALDSLEPVHADDRERMSATVANMLATGVGASIEYRRLRKDGTPTWTETSYTIVTEPESGAPVELITVSRDIDARKAMERQLVEARTRAETAAAAKADFLANMSHELRTPLNAIIGFSRVLGDSAELAPRDTRHVQLIRDASEALLLVVNDVLDFSKLESGAFDLDPQPFDPMVLAHSTAMLVGEQASERGLRLEVRGTGANLFLEGDGPRLRQVLLNLISNALKFTSRGAIGVSVDQVPAAGGLRRLRVTVSDTGIGIAADQLEAIFERFNQADVSVARRFGGTGLGLAICKRIVELMGGRIGVESRLGKGSTFWFEVELPLASEADRAAPAAGGKTVLERPLRLLLVEDVAVNQELARVMLGPFPIEIDTAENGEEAIAAVTRAAYDLVLMDVQMPVMDGLTAARRIRALESQAAKRLPIIAMTANVLPDQIARCLDAGMDGHIGKPISPTELIETIARWGGNGDTAAERGAVGA